MQLPKRIQSHVTETSSFKIFSAQIPDHWIIREITEKDYGIDCYIELVTTNHAVTGELISIQLKGMQSIHWTQAETCKLSSVKISTTNYWNKFPVPVFICLVDTTLEEVYFCPVRSFIRSNYSSYVEQQHFSYEFKKSNRLEASSLDRFVEIYGREKLIPEMEHNLTTFISHYTAYQDFIDHNTHRDCFMGVEYSRILYLKHFYQNVEFLCQYFRIAWDIPKLSELFAMSRERFGDNHDLYEQQLHSVLELLQTKLLPVLIKLRDHVNDVERGYWWVHDLTIVNVMINIKDDGSFGHDWEY